MNHHSNTVDAVLHFQISYVKTRIEALHRCIVEFEHFLKRNIDEIPVETNSEQEKFDLSFGWRRTHGEFIDDLLKTRIIARRFNVFFGRFEELRD